MPNRGQLYVTLQQLGEMRLAEQGFRGRDGGRDTLGKTQQGYQQHDFFLKN